MKRLAIFALLLVPAAVYAKGDTHVYNASIIPESAENILELINLIVSIFAAAFAVKLAALSQGGQLERTWNKLAVVAVVFAVMEIFAALKGYGLVKIGGLGDILEFVLAVLLAATFYTTRKQLLRQTLGSKE